MSDAATPAPIRVAVTGAQGRMGREVVQAVTGADGMEVVAAVGRGDDLSEALRATKPDVLVEFSIPESVMPNVRTALREGVVPLVGTTGIRPADQEELTALCAETGTGCLIAPNFALGAVLLMRFAAEAARYFPDVEIIELHHERKKDAPSGTAARTAEMIAASRNTAPAAAPSDAFEIFPGARGGQAAGDIPVHSVRLPGFVASQEVLFGGPGQRLSLRHDSIDRASFMPGVLLAIRRAGTIKGLVVGLEELL
ncbi:MAG: 4-hydroxy-tetrahydrodipicolinate reductase [Armatimonadaceae bacterium]